MQKNKHSNKINKHSNKIKLTLFSVISSLSLLCIPNLSLAQIEPNPAKEIKIDLNQEILSINKIPLTLKELKTISSFIGVENFEILIQNEQARAGLIDFAVKILLFAEKAKQNNTASSENFKTHIAAYKQFYLSQIYIDELISKSITDETIKEAYKANLATQIDVEEAEVNHILVTTEEEANEIKSKLAKGEKFEELAKTLSKDFQSGKDGGKLGFIKKTQVVEPFGDAAFSAKLNTVVGPVKTQFGYHIMEVLSKRKVAPPTLQQSSPSIKNNLSNKIIEDHAKKLKKEGNVIIKDVKF